MKTIKLLSISNSFGVNLQTYAHQIAEANGVDLDIYVLYIGGCSLELHAYNFKNNEPKYELYHNGESTHKFVSILEGLKICEKWDYILTQQVSQDSGKIETYEPYLSELFKYVKNNSKFDKFGFQETWEYVKTNEKFDQFGAYNFDSDLMHKMIHDTVKEISSKYENSIVINSGDIIHNARKVFSESLHDMYGFHLSKLGCYLIGANLVKLLLKENLKKVYLINDDILNEALCNKCIDFVNKEKSFE